MPPSRGSARGRPKRVAGRAEVVFAGIAVTLPGIGAGEPVVWFPPGAGATVAFTSPYVSGSRVASCSQEGH